ncbi:RING-H2 zinc finger protein (macronuclear) [Tetrahymena thermophila SB210]|uniref:RING-H2 zinc finger protein n=1 Tax=Tetrahymena thermophila (strain SB210) TaxID=312017 RepID=Q22DH5_TETTS|nr:RING-H2 zinc finger protein [Tetrahymena thermophila SB210]EAR83383.4 RING-H2 zinc finger protein [Tetrahymena thermophila SB210]|eukprot:XP_001031046.4 RING-H2 zinc finger protein [Tetrahymena thermophila SB210]
MEDNIKSQIRAPLLDVEADTSQQRGRRAYTSIDLPQQQNIQQGIKNPNQILELNSNANNQAQVNFRHSVGVVNHGEASSDDKTDIQAQQNNFLMGISNQNQNNSLNMGNENFNENEDEMEEENIDEEEIYDDSNYEMSKLFLSIFNDNRIFLIAVILCDAGMGGLSQLVYSKRCEEMSDLQYWNFQWGFYFFAKAVYHLFVFTQFFSSAYKLDICQKLGEFRSPEENELRQIEYEQHYTDRQRSQIRRSLEKQFLDYYYKRTSLLKWAYYIKSLVTLAYVIYGMVVFFSGNYFQIWISNNYNQPQSQQCDYALTWWVYLSIIFVIACNRQIFDLILIIAIVLPLALFIYFPYMVYKNCKKKRKRKQIFKNFKNLKFQVGKVQGDTECTICRMDYVIDEEITILPCNELHHFHKDCIMSWLNVNMTCPLCRHNFAEESSEEEQNEQQIVPAQQGQYVPPLQNQQQGQIIFQNQYQQQGVQNQYNPQQGAQQPYYQNNVQQNNMQYNNQQYQDQMILNQLIEMVDLFNDVADLQRFLQQNNYPPELQQVIIQLWHQRQAGMI